jgi:chromosome segregation ATPase
MEVDTLKNALFEEKQNGSELSQSVDAYQRKLHELEQELDSTRNQHQLLAEQLSETTATRNAELLTARNFLLEAEATVAVLKQHNKRLEEDLASTSDQKELREVQLTERAESLNSELDEVKQYLFEAETKTAELTEALGRSQKQLHDVEHDLTLKCRQKHAILEELAQTTAALADSHAALSEKNIKLNNSQRELDAQSHNTKDLQEALTKKDEEVQQAWSENASLTATIEVDATQRSTLDQLLAVREKEIQSLQQALEKKDFEAEEAAADLATLQASLATAQAEIHHLQALCDQGSPLEEYSKKRKIK